MRVGVSFLPDFLSEVYLFLAEDHQLLRSRRVNRRFQKVHFDRCCVALSVARREASEGKNAS